MGGHGGLNILPQKSWNVYGRKQRERVRRDEEQLEREQREEAARKEEEEKAKQLRALRGHKDEEEEKEKESVNKHVNFFEEHEKALASLERKQKAKKSEEDEANRLGGSGSHLRQPWYAKSDTSFYDDGEDDADDGSRQYRSLPKRIRMQREETERLRLAEKEQRPFENRPTLTKVMLTDGYVPPSERKRREKKEKKRKKKRRRSPSSSDDDTKEDEQTRALRIQKMREERERREMKERERAKSVFTNPTKKNPFA
jgi:hypothetical protein